MFTEESVFNRIEETTDSLSPRTYNFTIGAVLLWGFGINYWIVKNIDYRVIASINPVLFFIAYFALVFVGVYMFTHSDRPVISFLGYNLIVLPFGFLINIIVAQYDSMIVQEALRLTALVTTAMLILGTLYPAFFQKIVGALTISLIVVVIIESIEIFFFNTHHGFLDWIVVLIFCGYIGYDWGRANRIPKTLDNAIDSAAALYLDIINLFIRILRILGRRR